MKFNGNFRVGYDHCFPLLWKFVCMKSGAHGRRFKLLRPVLNWPSLTLTPTMTCTPQSRISGLGERQHFTIVCFLQQRQSWKRMHPLSRRCYSHLESGFRRLSQIPYRKGIYHSHFRRYQSTDSSSADSFSSDVDFKDEPPRAAAIVVGGGPAGIAAVGNFLEIFSGGKIIWIDKSFAGGMIPQYLDPLPR